MMHLTRFEVREGALEHALESLPDSSIRPYLPAAFVEWVEQSDAQVTIRTPARWCREFRELDTQYGTDKRSPLHHDNRCPLCNESENEND